MLTGNEAAAALQLITSTQQVQLAADNPPVQPITEVLPPVTDPGQSPNILPIDTGKKNTVLAVVGLGLLVAGFIIGSKKK